MRRLLVPLLLALALVLAISAPAGATSTNTIHRSTFFGCTVDLQFGNIGVTPYATSRLFSNSPGVVDCRIRSVEVKWANGPTAGNDIGYWQGAWNNTNWKQENGPNGAAAWFGASCVQLYHSNDTVSWAVYKGNIYDGLAHGQWVNWGQTSCIVADG